MHKKPRLTSIITIEQRQVKLENAIKIDRHTGRKRRFGLEPIHKTFCGLVFKSPCTPPIRVNCPWKKELFQNDDLMIIIISLPESSSNLNPKVADETGGEITSQLSLDPSVFLFILVACWKHVRR